MTPEQVEGRRYNRRTRAIEEQAQALNRIARALDTANVIAAAGTSVDQVNGTKRVWTVARAKELMQAITNRVDEVVGR